MRGRKIDSNFFETFVSSCVKNNKSSSNEILQEALDQLNHIDEKIKEAEKLKLQRAKILDIISVFETKNNSNKIQESKTLRFFNITNINLCKNICDKIKISARSFDDLMLINENNEEMVFAIKQLMEYKIISKIGKHFIRGESFEEYYNSILRVNG